jgi:hypothetical protein
MPVLRYNIKHFIYMLVSQRSLCTLLEYGRPLSDYVFCAGLNWQAVKRESLIDEPMSMRTTWTRGQQASTCPWMSEKTNDTVVVLFPNGISDLYLFPQRTVLTMGNCFPEICAVLALQLQASLQRAQTAPYWFKDEVIFNLLETDV